MKNRPNWLRENWLRVIVHIGVWGPLLWLAWRTWNDDLGVDPVVTLNNVTGRTAMILLLLCLSATPLYILFGFRQGLTVRRALGLYAFMYAGLHFLNFIALDYMFDLQFILEDGVPQKPYIFVGLAALLILTALAVTSTRGWMKRLKRNWTRVHWLIYPTGVLIIFHFLWQAKAAEKFEPVIYAGVLTFLLLVRVPPIRKTLTQFRNRRAPSVKPTRASVIERRSLSLPTQPTE
ncbi:MAG: sulfoxide reductase heme-binding subunit YedZ [Chloroflexi bacterium]|nr:sulfoxide reductase heme-binding subunit YedZ [Chloroflexota bacterium]